MDVRLKRLDMPKEITALQGRLIDIQGPQVIMVFDRGLVLVEGQWDRRCGACPADQVWRPKHVQ